MDTFPWEVTVCRASAVDQEKNPGEMMSKVRQVFLVTLAFSSEGSFVTVKLINDDLQKILIAWIVHTAVSQQPCIMVHKLFYF